MSELFNNGILLEEKEDNDHEIIISQFKNYASDAHLYWTDNNGNTWNEIMSEGSIGQHSQIGFKITRTSKVISSYSDGVILYSTNNGPVYASYPYQVEHDLDNYINTYIFLKGEGLQYEVSTENDYIFVDSDPIILYVNYFISSDD